MKLGKKLSGVQFVLSQMLILFVCLLFLGALYYLVNIQFQKPPKNSFSNGPVTSIPKTLVLNIDQPEDNLLSQESSVIFSGKTTPGGVYILISTDNNDLVIKSKADGSFSTVLDLTEGVNKISTTAFDPTGDSKSQDRIVYYSKEKI